MSKKRRLVFAILAALLVITIPAVAFAAWEFYFPLTTTDTSGVARVSHPVIVEPGGQSLIDSGYVDIDGLNTEMLQVASDKKYMVATDKITWVVDSLAAFGQETYDLYTGWTPDQSYFHTIAGEDGYITMTDDDTLELGNDFEIEAKWYIDTVAGTDKNLIYKQDAFQTYVSAAEEITARILDDDSINPAESMGGANHCMRGIDAVYLTAHDQAVADDVIGQLQIGQFLVGGPLSYVIRGAVLFDTSAIPDDATITSAVLHLVGTADNSDVEFDIVIRNGMPARPSDPLVVADFNYTFYTGDGGSINSVAWNAAGDNPIALNSTGLGWINLTGTTKFVLVSSRDISASAPGGNEYVEATHVGTTLTVNYTDPLATVTATGVSSGEFTVTVTEVDNTGAGWLAGWDNRIRFDVDATKVDANLTQFPILLKLSSSSGIGSDDVTAVFDELGANKLKLAVTESDGTTEMYVEVERWDNGAEEAWLWTALNTNTIDSATDTTFYLYFDNDHADNNARVGVPNDAVVHNVWDANFVLVDHLLDGVNNASTYDSTSNNNDGAKTLGNEPVEIAGQIADAQDFDMVNDKITVTDAVELQDIFDGGGTAEVIINPNSDGGLNSGNFLNKNDTDGWYFLTGSEAGGKVKVSLNVIFTGNDGQWTSDNLVIDLGTASEVILTYDSSSFNNDPIIYVDGVLIDITETVIPAGVYETDVGTDFFIGSNLAGNLAYDGIIDEVRLSNIIRSVAWTDATYDTNWDDFIDFIPNADGELIDYSLDFKIYIDTVLEDRILGVSVPGNNNDWQLIEKNVVSYLEYYHHTVGEVMQAWYQPNYMVQGNLFEGTVDAGTQTTLDDAILTQVDDYWTQAQLTIISTTDGLAPEGESRAVTDFATANDRLTFGALSVPVEAGDIYALDFGSFEGTADAGTQTTLDDAELVQENDYWNLARITITEAGGVAPEGETAVVTDFDTATDRLTFGTLTAAVQNGDTYEIAFATLVDRSYYGLDFDALGDEVVVTDAASIQNVFDGGGSISLWTDVTSDGENNEGRIADKTAWYVRVDNEAVGMVKITFWYDFDGVADGTWVTDDTQLTIGDFDNLVITYNADDVANNPIFYVNDTALTVGIGLTESTTPVGTRVTDVASDLYIGDEAGGTHSYDGVMDEYWLFDDIMTAGEVTTNYNSGDGSYLPSDTANLVLELHIEDGSGATATDTSGNGNDGAITNATWVTGYVPRTAGNAGTNDSRLTWGANSNLVVVYGEIVSFESTTSTVATDDVGFDVPTVGMPTNWFGTGALSPDLPFYPTFLDVSIDTGIPLQTIYLWLVFGVAMSMAVAVVMLSRSTIVGVIIFTTVMVYGANANIVAWWIIFVYLIMVTGIIFLSSRTNLGG